MAHYRSFIGSYKINRKNRIYRKAGMYGEIIPPLNVLEVEKAENAIIEYVQGCTSQDEMFDAT